MVQTRSRNNNNNNSDKAKEEDHVEPVKVETKAKAKKEAKNLIKEKVEQAAAAATTSAGKKANEEKVDAIEATEEETSSSDFELCSFLTSETWKEHLKDEFEKDYFKKLNKTLNSAYKKDVVYPPKELIFNAFNLTELENIKVVILGQDPYHDKDQAHGLAFSVPKGVELPRTLKNIYTELSTDIEGFKPVSHGCFLEWAQNGVFLLNTILTVREHTPASHAKIGWEIFIDRVIQLISEKNSYCVFLLWGNLAHKKSNLIDETKHAVIKTAHPSPLSQNKFSKCACFSRANELLQQNGKSQVNWSLTE